MSIHFKEKELGEVEPSMCQGKATNDPTTDGSTTGTVKKPSEGIAPKPRRGLLGSFRYHVLLPIAATFNVPPYSLMFWMIPYNFVMCTTKLQWLRAIMIAYWGYIFVNRAAEAPKKTKFIRLAQRFGNWLPFLRLTAEYFPVSLTKTKDLPPEKPYIFSYHPHGVIGMGVSSALSTDGCGFSTKFPGVDRNSATLNMNFMSPIYRHWMLWMGCISANKKTLVQRLNNGESLILLPGGAKEALYAHPQSMKLCIRNRKGFVKLAMETNAGLVPAFGFGENDAFDTAYMAQDEATSGNHNTTWSFRGMVWKVQKAMYNMNSYSLPLWFHIVPRRRPIGVVVGAPVNFPKDATVDEAHAIYLESLQKLYDEHKAEHGYKDVELEFV